MESQDTPDCCARPPSRWLQLEGLTLVYIMGELSHFLLGVVTTPMSQEIHYGDHGCLSNPDWDSDDPIPDGVYCYNANNSQQCSNLWTSNSTNATACDWDYSGLGLQYQVLAGPAFVLVFTVTGVFMGFVSDRYNRKTVLLLSLLVLTAATTIMGAAQYYWQLVLLRMMIGAGESSFAPTASSMIADMFNESMQAFALGIFNWGIYIGYGLAYVIGNYVTAADINGQGWRWSYYVAGCIGAVAIVALVALVREPVRRHVRDGQNVEQTRDSHVSDNNEKDTSTISGSETDGSLSVETVAESVKDPVSNAGVFCQSITTPALMMLCLAASVRHTGGFTWAYNTQLYFQTYYPDFDVGTWVSIVSIVGGSVGVASGGFISDRLVKRLGPRARLYVLSATQLIATPFAAGVLYFPPPGAMYSLLGSYLFAESWFGIMFAVLLDIAPLTVQSSTLAFFLFVMNNIGGNLPVVVTPLRAAVGYRNALLIMYPGMFLLSSVLFFLTSFFVPKMHRDVTSSSTHSLPDTLQQNKY